MVVSHRFATVQRADHIVVLSGGQVSEAGTHAQLLNRRGVYAQMRSAQVDGLETVGDGNA